MNRSVVPCLLLCLLPIGFAAMIGTSAGAPPAPAVAPADDEPPKPTNLEKINTDKDEDDPHASSAGFLLFYSQTSKTGTKLMWSQRRLKTQAWPAGKPFPETESKQAEARSAFLTPDGKFPQQLYFGTNKDLDRKNNRGNNFDIFYFIKQRADADFTTETPVQTVDTAADELHPWLLPSGQSMYFSRKTKDGWKVFVSRKPIGGGQWQKSEEVKLPVGFHHPTLTPDGRTMYVQGPLEGDRWGLFRVEMEKATVGGKPEPLTELNSSEGPRGDMSPNLSRDGQILYFASDRPGGKGGLDIYAVRTVTLSRKVSQR